MSALLDNEPGNIGLIVSSRSDAYGLKRATRLGYETLILDKKVDWNKLHQDLEQRQITHIFLTGFMKVVPKEFLALWNKPIFNVHPSLLPKYPGLKSVERAISDRADIGVTVHKVIADVDAGETVAQSVALKFDEYSSMTKEMVELALHLTEYRLVRQVHKAVSC